MICCKTTGNPQIPSKLETEGLSLTPAETDMDSKKEKNDQHNDIDDIQFTLLENPDIRNLNLGHGPRASKLLLSLRSAVSRSCRDVFHK